MDLKVLLFFLYFGCAFARQILQDADRDVDWMGVSKKEPIVNANYKYEGFENSDNSKRSHADDKYAKYKCMQTFDLQERASDVVYANNLREEVSKLQDLVQVLRDQQYILKILNEMDSNNHQDFIPHSMLKHLKKIDEEKEDFDIRQNVDGNNEVDMLRKEIEALKSTISKPKEYRKLDDEMHLQRDEILLLKNMLDKVLNKNDAGNYGKEKSNVTQMIYELSKIENKLGHISNKNNTEEILGSAAPNLPTKQNLSSIHNLSRSAKQNDMESIMSLLGRKAKSNVDNDEITILLKKLSKQSKTNSLELDEDDVQEQLLDLQKKLKKKKKKKTSMEDQLKKLEKQIKLQSKTIDDDDDDIDDDDDESDSKAQMKKIQLALKKLKKKEKVQSKTDDDDDDMESQLKQLAVVIRGMQSKNEEDENDGSEFNLHLNKLISKNNGPKLSQSEIRVLRKKIMAMKQGNHNNNNHHNNNNDDDEDDKPVFSYEEIGSEEDYPKHYNPPNHYQYGYSKKTQFGAYPNPNYGYNPYYNPNINYNQYSANQNYYPRPNHYQKQFVPNPPPYNPNSNIVNNNNYDSNANYKPSYSSTVKQYANPQYSQDAKVPAHPAPQIQYAPPKAEEVHPQPAYAPPPVKSSPQFFPAPSQQKISTPTYNPNPPQNLQEPYDHPLQNPSPEQKVSDLKNQIYELQGVIDTFNKPEYLQQPEDKETVYNLDRQIKDLKVVINNITQDYPTYQNTEEVKPPVVPAARYSRVTEEPEFRNYDLRKHRKILDLSKRDVSFAGEDDSSPKIENCDENYAFKPNPKNNVKKTRNKRNGESSEEAESALGVLTSLFGQALGASEEEAEDVRARGSKTQPKVFGDVERRIEELKKQLGSVNPRSNYYQPYYPGYADEAVEEEKESKDLFKTKKKSKKLDLFEKIFDKILNKVIDKAKVALPKLLEALVGKLDFSSYYADDGYGDGYGNGGYQMDKSYKSNFGLSGILPMIVIKVISNISYFVSYLQKYRFLRVFLVPALVLLIVAGAIIFLVWWMQPSDDYQQTNYNVNSNYEGGSNYGNNYNTYGSPGYSKKYSPNSYSKPNYNNYRSSENQIND
ncbi:PREDICTED: bromodomain-containing protein DDB_G0280777-like [Nicrophorus vespilloides]|uniref:Bromodomain-containing protein DDB_G0280777-like n=1 Tax=Nicrophorus vespilloides TaxID=110193 RepID=A0ABM1NJ78_NICVS|nr:PREDICTED: bromodomain-containing protein DDB_G0280777-like [Nicrophorus vespilloides]